VEGLVVTNRWYRLLMNWSSHKQSTRSRKMDNAEREKKEQLVNHLINKREKIERDTVGRPAPDYRKTYNYMSDEIAKLKMELFQVEYKDFEHNLNHVLGIGRTSK
jgi:hypothetical protein